MALYMKHISRWLRKLGITARSKETDDLVQEALIGLLTLINQYDPSRGPFAYIAYRRIDSRVRDAIRRSTVLAREVVTESQEVQAALDRQPDLLAGSRRVAANPLDLLVEQEELAEWRRRLCSHHLGTLDWQVLRLRYRGLKPCEIADALGLPRAEVYQAMRRLRMLLRRSA